MDSQLKRGFTDIYVLAVMAHGDSYGYRIVHEAPEALGLTESTLYPVLRRLCAQGFLDRYSHEHNGRLRRYYSITEEGRGQLASFASEAATIVRVLDYVEGAAQTC